MRKYKDGELESIICNNCSRVVNELGNDEYGFMREPFREFKLKYGYGSQLFDLSIIQFDLCEFCLLEMFEEFNISPHMESYDWLDGGEGIEKISCHK